MQRFAVPAPPEQAGSKWWIVMVRAAPIVLKVLFLSAWKLARNIFSAIPGHATSHLSSRDVMPSYSWEHTPWRVRPVAYSATLFSRKPGTTRGSMIRWSVRAGSWRPSPDVGMSPRYLSLVAKQPAAGGPRCWGTGGQQRPG